VDVGIFLERVDHGGWGRRPYGRSREGGMVRRSASPICMQWARLLVPWPPWQGIAAYHPAPWQGVMADHDSELQALPLVTLRAS
jgi:hypothetical protein